MRHSKTLISSSVALALVGAGLGSAVVAVAQSGGNAAPGAQSVATDVTTAASAVSERKAQVSPTLSARFGALRDARTARDAMPADVARAQGTPHGENVAQSQLAAQTASGTRYYLVPAAETVCVLSEEGAGGCPAPGGALDGDFTVVLCAPDLRSGHVRILGLLPDGVDDIDVRAKNGATARFDVTNNVVVADVSTSVGTEPAAVTWTDSDGRTQRENMAGPWKPPGPCA